jgi:hypothetical protein
MLKHLVYTATTAIEGLTEVLAKKLIGEKAQKTYNHGITFMLTALARRLASNWLKGRKIHAIRTNTSSSRHQNLKFC